MFISREIHTRPGAAAGKPAGLDIEAILEAREHADAALRERDHVFGPHFAKPRIKPGLDL